MAAQMSSSSVDKDQPRLSVLETKRIKELFKYFLAASRATGFADSDIDSQEGYTPDAAQLSSDPVINALAQLAACQLSCDRAFISLIDDKHQHVIAEVTRKISLYHTEIYPPGSGICIGARRLDLISGVCAGTMPAFIDGPLDGPMIETDNIYGDRTRYVIRDFAIEEMYKDRPYVTGFPFMRYYAEVPIKTARGYVIGTLSVVDNEPRDGLDEDGFRALTEIASAIMRHLEMVKTEQDHAEASRLLRGLNTFAQMDTGVDIERDEVANETINIDIGTNSKADENFETSLPESKSQPVVSPDETDTHYSPSTHDSVPPESSTSYPSFETMGLSEPTTFLTEEDEQLQGQSSSDVMEPAKLPSLDPGFDQFEKTPTQTYGAKLRDLAVSKEVRATFSRAAHILRKAMDMDGVIFLDAALSDFGSRGSFVGEADLYDSSHNINVYSESPKEHDPLEREDALSTVLETLWRRDDYSEGSLSRLVEQKTLQPTSQAQPRMSGRLGYSTRGPLNASDNVISTYHFSLPEVVLQSLLRQFPHGHIFDYSQESGHPFSRRRLSIDNFEGRPKKRMRMMKKSTIFKIMGEIFPDAWFAGGLGWTTTEKRVLQKEDFAYFSVFGNSIMAEVARLELIASDRAKADFISSVSHELRSPLHGILGSSELLRETALNASQEQMVSMVENCGRTLLDTMDHILDFTKLSKVSLSTPSNANSAEFTSGSDSVFSLDAVLEDTIETVLTGYHFDLESKSKFKEHGRMSYRSEAQEIGHHNPTIVVLDIDRQSLGHLRSDIAAWRRIILNVFGNALKYTEKGLIEVILRSVSTSGPGQSAPAQKMMTLTIRDTGHGIGKAYLQNHLYTPFVQENSLSQGVGLGLSIVKKLVNKLHGTLNLQSEAGLGTQITISIPITVISPSDKAIFEIQHTKATLCLLGLDFYPDLHFTPTGILPEASKVGISLKGAIRRYAQDWLGINVISASSVEQTIADIVVVSEDKLHLLNNNSANGSRRPAVRHGSSLLILSTSSSGSNWRRTSDRINFIGQPYGPRKIVAAIRLALEADRSGDIWEVDGRLPPTTSPDQTMIAGLKENKSITASQNEVGASISTEIVDKIQKKLNVLLVDDNDVNLNILAKQMKKLGCEYKTAMNGQEAVDAYRSSEKIFDFVLMDISMPVMDGFAATRAIRDLELGTGRPATVVIAMTGLGSPAAQREGFTSGMNLFLTKPVSMKTVKQLVEHGIESLQQREGPVL